MAVIQLGENREAKANLFIDLPQDKEPVADYIKRLSQAVRSEQETLREYQTILQCPNITDNVRNAIEEIIEDEKDHMVIFASLASLEINEAFPKNGDLDKIEEASKLKRKKVKQHKVEEAAEIKKISSDSLNYTATYEVTVNIKVKEGNLLKSKMAIEDAILELNQENKYDDIKLIQFTKNFMQYVVKIPDEADFNADELTDEIIKLADSDYIDFLI